MSGPETQTVPALQTAKAGNKSSRSTRWWLMAVVTTVGLALLSALATFMVLAGMVPIIVTRDLVNSLFIANGVLIFILVIFVLAEGIKLFRARRAGQASTGC